MGCQQTAPPGSGTGADSAADTETETGSASDTTSDTTSDTGQDEELDSYFPLVEFGHWEYVARTTSGQVLGTEIVDASAADYLGQSVLLFVDNPNSVGEWTESWINRQGSTAARIHKEIKDGTGTTMIVDYTPGFARFDDAWTEVGPKGEQTYERVETDGQGQNPIVDTRGHTFEVTDLSQSVTVPAGTFDCIAVTRIRTTGASAGEVVHFWYAAGIGKVKEERPADNRVEELTAVVIPGGVDLP